MYYLQIMTVLREAPRHFPKYEFQQYTLNEDFLQNVPLPNFAVCVLMFHDWPHEEPPLMVRFLQVFDSPRRTIPSKEQALFIFNKTHYLSECMKHNIPIQPTVVVKPDANLRELSEHLSQMFANEGKFVTKLNFSASALEVQVHDFKTAADIEAVLQSIQAQVLKTARQHRYYSTEFVAQRYESLYLSNLETRIFYSKGEVLYAMVGGWLDGPNNRWKIPEKVDLQDIPHLLAIGDQMLAAIPQLRDYYLIRFDFGPGPTLNEIELFADTFGGPNNDMSGSAWVEIKRKITDNIIADIKKHVTEREAALMTNSSTDVTISPSVAPPSIAVGNATGLFHNFCD
jgi:hypothetical protein